MERTILAGALLLDGSGGPPVAARSVVVAHGRIAAVVAAAGAPSVTALRLDGFTLLPGLINCHVHLCFGGDADPAAVMMRESYPSTVIRAVLRARATVEAGVTTGRDLGGRDYAELSVRDAIRQGLIAGPRVLCAGKGVCMTGGHGWNMIGREADGPDDVRKAVREQLKAGADVIKIFATGGVMTVGVDPTSAQLTLDEVRAEVEVVVKGGMAPLAAIASATVTAARALGLEHETGRIAPGLAADLLAVAGNPAESLQALDDVRLVLAQGRVVVNRLTPR